MARMRKVRNLSYFAEDLGSCLWYGTTKCSQLKDEEQEEELLVWMVGGLRV